MVLDVLSRLVLGADMNPGTVRELDVPVIFEIPIHAVVAPYQDRFVLVFGTNGAAAI